jgi:predicted dehydrogenase
VAPADSVTADTGREEESMVGEGERQDPVRWAILGAARIAARSFVPGLDAAGGGIAEVVAGRDPGRTDAFARRHGVRRTAGDYRAAIDDPAVDAVYVPLPNALHARWTIAALQAGKAVLCEKPLCDDVEQTELVLAAAAAAERPLWEAFVFPFQSQTARVRSLIDDGAIGEIREIHSAFHFDLGDRADIRFSADLSGGALADVGCYPVRWARLVFGAEPESAKTSQVLAETGVDAETWGTLDFPGGRRLLFSCSFTKARDTTARVLGTAGEMRLTSPFHGGITDTIQLRRPDGTIVIERSGEADPPFTAAIQHIHAVLRGEEAPRHLAVDDAFGNAAALDAIRRSSASDGDPVSRPGS